MQLKVLNVFQRGEAPTLIASKIPSSPNDVSPNHVMAAVLEYARAGGLDYQGDGTFYEDFDEPMAALPSCENDEDWELMRHVIGITKEQSRGYGDMEDWLH